jgi:hypothetical protein
MKIELQTIEPAIDSIDRELLISFKISEIDTGKVPIGITGNLYLENGKKIGTLCPRSNNGSLPLWLNAHGANAIQINPSFTATMSCQLSENVIHYIEDFRLNQKPRSKDLLFQAKLLVQELSSNVVLASLKLGDEKKFYDEKALEVVYKYDNHFRSERTNMWILSGDSGPNFLSTSVASQFDIPIRIELMTWINEFMEYLKLGKIIVHEFLMPDEIKGSKRLNARYQKAQKSLVEMQKQLKIGEWKQAIIAGRPVYELFKHFDEFKTLLLESGYSIKAYDALNESIKQFFNLLSKIYHGLEQDYETVTDIPVYSEDAQMVYAFSISILQLISGKMKRNSKAIK